MGWRVQVHNGDHNHMLMLRLMIPSTVNTAGLQIQKFLLFSPPMDQCSTSKYRRKPPRAESSYVGHREVYNVIAKAKMIWFYGRPDDGGLCTHTAHLLFFLHSFPAFFSHSISFLGGIGIALFSSSSQCRLLSTVTLLLEYLSPSCCHVGANQLQELASTKPILRRAYQTY
jgi:hypothetical protein